MKSWEWFSTKASTDIIDQLKRGGKYNYNLKIIGVSGTVGKTTTAELITEYLNAIGKRVFYLGTSGVKCKAANYIQNNFPSTSATTTDMLKIFMHGAYFYQCEYLVLEVTAETIAIDVYKDLDFDYFAFTNLKPNIVRSFRSDNEYFAQKLKIFNTNKVGKILSSNKNKNLNKLLSENYGCKSNLKTFNYKSKITNGFLDLMIDGKTYETNLISSINADNVALFYRTIKAMGLLDETVMKKFLDSIFIAGRLERLEIKGRTFIIDTGYGGVEGLTPFFEETKDKNIIVVMSSYFFDNFNDTTDNLIQKRKERAALVYKYASKMCLTATHRRTLNNNTNSEQCVIDQLQLGAPNAIQIYNRMEAIRWAIEHSKKGDYIVVIGTGSETWGQIGNTATAESFIGDKEYIRLAMSYLIE